MSKKNRQKRFGIYFGTKQALFISIFLLLATLRNSSAALKPLGFIVLGSLLLLNNLFFIRYLSVRKKIPRLLIPVLLNFVIFLNFYVTGLLLDGLNSRSLAAVGMLFLILCFFTMMSLLPWRRQSLQVLSLTTGVYISVNALLWIVHSLPRNFSSYLANPNTLGGILFCLLFFPITEYLTTRNKNSRTLWLLIIIVGIGVILATKARSVWLAIVASFVTYLFWKFIIKKQSLFWGWLFSVFCIIGLFVYGYSALFNHNQSYYYNSIIKEYTGGNLFSGRQILWSQLIEVIGEKPWLGYGSGALPNEVIQIPLSAHNLFLQIALQVGITGLFSFLLLLGSIWYVFWVGRTNQLVRLSGAFFIGILVHQTFEVSLTQNALSIGLMQWLILAIGISNSLDERIRCKKIKAVKEHSS